MKNNKFLNSTLSLCGGIFGIIASQIIFIYWFKPFLSAAGLHGEPGCYEIADILVPFLSDMCLVGGILWLISAYGFFTEKKWSFLTAITANILSLQGSFFPNVPAMISKYTPLYFVIFIPNLLLYFILMFYTGKKDVKQTLTGFLMCLAFIFCFMNGVASANRSITYGWPVFIMTYRLHWIASICFGISAIAFINKPGEWCRVLCMSAVFLELSIGIPLGIRTALYLKRFSMFFVAPVTCIPLLFIVFKGKLWKISREIKQ